MRSWCARRTCTGPGGWYEDELVKRLRQPGRLAVVGQGDNWWDVVRVEDVATALADAAERAPAGAVYHVVDDEPITFYDFVALTAKALGLGPPRRIPIWLANVAAGRNAVRAAVRSARSSNARIKRRARLASGLSDRGGGRAGRRRTNGVLTHFGRDSVLGDRGSLSRRGAHLGALVPPLQPRAASDLHRSGGHAGGHRPGRALDPDVPAR